MMMIFVKFEKCECRRAWVVAWCRTRDHRGPVWSHQHARRSSRCEGVPRVSNDHRACHSTRSSLEGLHQHGWTGGDGHRPEWSRPADVLGTCNLLAFSSTVKCSFLLHRNFALLKCRKFAAFQFRVFSSCSIFILLKHLFLTSVAASTVCTRRMAIANKTCVSGKN